MGKLYMLLLGMVIGFGICMVAMTYHIVYANDGVHLIAKIPARLEQPFVDLRGMSPQELAENPKLVAAIHAAKKDHLLAEEAKAQLEKKVDDLFDKVAPPAEAPEAE